MANTKTSLKRTIPLTKAARTDARCTLQIAFATWRSRPLLSADMHPLIADHLQALEETDHIQVFYYLVGPTSIQLKVVTPATVAPLQAVSAIKRTLHRAIMAAFPAIRKRAPSIFTRAAWIRSTGQPEADAASLFLARERGARNA